MNKWQISVVAHGLSDGDAVRIYRTGFDDLDNVLFAADVIDDNNFYLLLSTYIGDESGVYADEAYLENTEAEVVLEGYARKAVLQADGLSHLEGLTVQALCDGEVVTGLTVEDGSVTLPDYYSKVTIGLPYVTYVEPTGVAMSQETGAKDGQTARIHGVSARFLDTIGVTVAAFRGSNTANEDITNWRDISWKEDGDTTEETDLFSGLVYVPLESNYTVEPRVVFRQDKPLPMNMLSAVYNYKITGSK